MSKPERSKVGGGVTESSREPARVPDAQGRTARTQWCSLFLFVALTAHAAPPFAFPTANHFLLEAGQAERFYVGTVGKPWPSGGFGCVRSDGWQMHEGLDIRCLQRDKKGEPTDPVRSTAPGTVAYVNHRSGLSNYGRYIIIRHEIEGFEVYSLYAHLREIRDGLRTGQKIEAGEQIAVMGRTTNTRQPISKERAHVHFELNFVLNDAFPRWYSKAFPGQRNDHGPWNGQNLAAIDPARIFLAQDQQGAHFRFLNAIRHETELCRVLVRVKTFPWITRHPQLRKPNPLADKEGVAGYELALNFNGLPFEFTPKAESEISGKAKFQLLSVNEAEYQKRPCRKLVTRKGTRFDLGSNGQHLLSLLTY